MTITEFDKLSDDRQYDLIFTKGDFVKNYVTPKERCNLYALWTFFIEVRYDPISNTIIGKNTFKEGELLDKYTTGF